MKKKLISFLTIILIFNPFFQLKALAMQSTYNTMNSSNTQIIENKSVNYKPILSYNLTEEFNGTNSFMDISNDLDYVKNLASGSIVLKFKTSSNSTQTLFSISDSTDSSSHFEIKLIGDDIRLEIKEKGTNLMSYTKTGLNLNDGDWHTAIISGGDMGNILYIDGIKIVDYSEHTNKFISLVTTPNSMNIGKSINTQGDSSFFNGNIEFIEIYDKQFSHEYSKKYSLNDYKELLKIIHGNNSTNIVFTGDSITQGVLHTNGYRTYSEHFSERFKGESINGNYKINSTIVNTGVSSATTRDLLNGFDKWVAINNPNIVFITLGMNDCTSISPTEYKNNIKIIIEKTRALGAIPVLQTSNTTNGSRVTQLEQFMDILRETASELDVFLIDHNQYWKDNESSKVSWLNDPIHPNQIGHLEFAKLIFKEFNMLEENSYTSNLSYPLKGSGTSKSIIESITYPEGLKIDDLYPIVSYKVNRTFFGNDFIDKTRDIDKIKNLSKGTIVTNFNLASSKGAQTIISLSDSSHASKEVAIGINTNGSIFLNGRTDNGTVNFTTAKNGYNNGKWHTLAITFDENEINVYVDNEKIHSVSNKVFYSSLNTPTHFSIGKNVHNTGDEWFFDGNLSNVDIYSQVLNNEQISLLTFYERNEYDFNEIRNKALENGVDNSWVFIGDSMTTGNNSTYGYKNYVEYFDERIRWEYNNNQMIHRQRFITNSASKNIDSSYIVDNFDTLVKNYNPELISIMLGANESISIDEFENNIRQIISQAKSINALIMLQTPVLGSKDLSSYSDSIKKVALEENIPVVDHYNKWLELEKNNSHLKEAFLTSDLLPNHRGHLRIAQDMMKALNMYSSNSIACGSKLDLKYDDSLLIPQLKQDLETLILKCNNLLAQNNNFDNELKQNLESDLTYASEKLTNNLISVQQLQNIINYLTNSLKDFEDSIINDTIEPVYKIKNLLINNKDTSSITISWEPGNNSANLEYLIYLDGNLTTKLDSKTFNYTFENLKSNRIYNLKVVTTNKNGDTSKPASISTRTDKQ